MKEVFEGLQDWSLLMGNQSLLTTFIISTQLSCIGSHLHTDLQTAEAKKNTDKLHKEVNSKWVSQCGIQDSQKISLSLKNGRFEQVIQIYLDKGCPVPSLAAEYRSSGTFQLGQVIDSKKNMIEFDYTQEDLKLTLFHRSYVLAYNAKREFSYLKPFCKDHSFNRLEETQLIGKECLEESNEYNVIPNSIKFYSSLILENGKLLEAKGYDSSRDGSQAKTRLISFTEKVTYHKMKQNNVAAYQN